MFEFLDMFGTYAERKVARTEKKNVIIDTCSVTDSDQPYETAIKCDLYKNGFIVVQMYETKEEALEGHETWCKIFSDVSKFPESLKDVGTSDECKLADAFSGVSVYKKKRKE